MRIHRSMSFVAATAIAVVLACPVMAQDMEFPEPDGAAVKAFEDVVAAYRQQPAVRVKTTIAVNLMDGDVSARSDEKTAEVFFTPPKDGVINGTVTINNLICSLNDSHINIVHSDNPDAYFTIPDDGEPYWVLLNVFRDMPFPHLAIGLTEDTGEDLWMMLQPMLPYGQPSAVRTQTDDAGVERQVIEMSSDDGTFTMTIDPETMRMESAEATITGGQIVQPGATLTYEYTFAYDDAAGDQARISFDPAERQRVDHWLALAPPPPDPAPAPGAPGQAAEQFAGQKAPAFTLSTMTGDAVDSEDLIGHVVILDFWATWCGPCIQALPRLHEVDRWARQEDLPVSVYAVNTLERGDTADAKLKAVQDFWKQKQFSLPVLMDYSNQTAGEYGVRGIPRTVIIRADGIVHTVHVGFNAADPDGYVQMLKDDIQTAIKALEL